MIGYGLSVALIFGALSGWLVYTLFPHYLAAKVFIWIALAALVFRCLNLCLTAFIQSLGGYNAMLRINSRNLFTMLVGCLLGMHFDGARGIAIGVVIAEMLNSAQQAHVLFKTKVKN